jgi:predicted PP-loop superfamily ATPase
MQKKVCSRCLLNSAIPGVKFPNQDNVCSVCHDYDNTWGNWNEKRKEIEQIFERAKKKRRDYDVLVPLSGGRDSSYVLYLCRKVFNLKCLAITFDNGFLSDHAKQNIKKACEYLGAHHVYFSFDRNFIMNLYKKVFLKSGFICPVCMRGMSVAIGRIQSAFDIPISLSGTSRRTEEHVDSAFFLQGDLDFLENVLSENGNDSNEQVLLRPIGIFRSPIQIKLPDYLDWNYKKIYQTITSELGWTSPEKNSEHTDCRVEPVVQYIRYLRFPDITPELLRYSKLVTCGQMSRDEALTHVEEVKNRERRPPELDYFLQNLGIKEEEFNNVLAKPLIHSKYMTRRSAAVRRIKALKQYISSL